MDPGDLARPDPQAAPALGESRTRVLAVLRSAGAPLTAGQVAERVDLHPNTARFHLDALVKAGLAAREAEDRERPGRPRLLFAAAPEGAATGRRSYRLLAEILTGHLVAETPHPARAALHAGHAWGRYLAERPPPFRRLNAAEAVSRLVRTLDDIGFAPETTRKRILLRHCPFREIAEAPRSRLLAAPRPHAGPARRDRRPGESGPPRPLRRALPVHRPPHAQIEPTGTRF